MIVYLDTSDLVKLYVEERGSRAIADLVDEAQVVAVSALAFPEACAAFARRARERLITTAQARLAVSQLERDWARFLVLSLDEELARAAGRLAARHALRGADAVHLASFEALLRRVEDEDVRFSCADERLVRAAKALR